jgi:uncharacterized protein YuzE
MSFQFERHGDISAVDLYILTTEDINLPSLPIGTGLKVGDQVLLEVSQIGKVCHNRRNIFYTVEDCVIPGKESSQKYSRAEK